MKTLFITLMLIVITSIAMAQTERSSTIYKRDYMDGAHWSIKQSITNEVDTSYHLFFAYKDYKYDYITVVGSVIFYQYDDAYEFLEKLNEFAKIKTSDYLIFKGDRYVISRSKMYIYIEDNKGNTGIYNKSRLIKMHKEIMPHLSLLKKNDY